MQLTPGNLVRVVRGEENVELRVQMINIKLLETQGGEDRYRGVTSDSTNVLQCMFVTSLNEEAKRKIARFTLIEILKYTTAEVAGGRKIIIIHELGRVINEPSKGRIGNPVAINQEIVSSSASQSSPQDQKQQKSLAPVRQSYQEQVKDEGKKNARQDQGYSTSSYGGGQSDTVQIKDLTPYQNKWKIRARLLSKSDIRHWSNAKGEGSLFSCVFSDESGQIKTTGFKDAVSLFYDRLTLDTVYEVSKGSLKQANKQYSTTNHDYEMYIDPGSIIELCEDQNAIKIKFDFVTVRDLEEMDIGKTVDMMLVVQESSEVTEIMTKANKPLKKRDIVVADASMGQIRMTLWGQLAEQPLKIGGIIAAKSLKVGDFGGRSLSTTSDSFVQIDPDHPNAHTLRGWLNSNTADFKSLSSTSNKKVTETKTIHQITEESLGMNDRPDFFNMKATISYIRAENISYPACKTDNCNKKVADIGNGWRCEKCDLTMTYPDYRYILSSSVVDSSGQMWVMSFNEAAQVIVGVSADELNRMREQNSDLATQTLAAALGKTWVLECRAKSEVYQDESKLKITVLRAEMLDFVKESRDLIALIGAY